LNDAARSGTALTSDIAPVFQILETAAARQVVGDAGIEPATPPV
jgi:hypothetical protein